jgi:K+-transporting ATPase ATPase C chain
MKTIISQSVRMLIVMTVLTGILYPVIMTLFSLAVFPYQAKGSMIEKNGTIIGSELIGQGFVSDRYFHPRPSGIGYNPMPSGGTNWGPTDKRLQDSAQARAVQFRAQNKLSAEMAVPNEMLFASASGVDPHISPESALLQARRIAAARGFTSEQTVKLKQLVDTFSEGPQMKLFGDPRVNVLKLNLALDEMKDN